ncbi:MAG: DNA polymerase III subunit gamma/tau [Chloroflexi bacterium]|nr:DNA polymerase III subunit gamma/tau [Chloroflexota bacterium]
MPGEVLYRKWRPPRFENIVGQDVVTQTLTRAVAGNRTAHAYLFCGPRGTGKTSTARVMAKALNCTMRPDGVGDPCGACDACTAIDNGSFLDLIEIDAASNRGIDEMRDLREKVRFAPTLGKTKVYIIDEAHALTPDAFNAFLKTLEEPPPQTVFILATTEPQKLPATIISRCQRFDFHRISTAAIVERLSEIAASEGAEIAPDGLRTIARTAGGSLRDATNVLDQLITSFGPSPTLEQLQELLGIGGEDEALALAKHLLAGDTTASLELVNAVAAEGVDLRPLHRMTVDFLRAALLMKSGVQDALDLSADAHSQLSGSVDGVSIDHILRALRLFGAVDLRYDQPSPLPLELAAVELGLEHPKRCQQVTVGNRLPPTVHVAEKRAIRHAGTDTHVSPPRRRRRSRSATSTRPFQ